MKKYLRKLLIAILLNAYFIQSAVAVESEAIFQSYDNAISQTAEIIAKKIYGEKGRIKVISAYGGRLLLTGEVTDNKIRDEIFQQISKIDGVKHIDNDIVTSELSSSIDLEKDLLIEKAVKSIFLNNKNISPSKFHVVVDRRVVYLMGRVTRQEGQVAALAAREASSGIYKIVKLFLYVPPANQQTDVAINEERRKLDADRQTLEFERQRLSEERNRREQSKQSSKLSLQTTTTNPDVNGNVTISVRTNADTSSLKVNGEEQGGRLDGNYVIKKVARVGQDTQFIITAVDINGNSDTKTITVSRGTVESAAVTASLNPENIKSKSPRDALAVIIGISNYKSLPRADFAKDDAQVFYDYAIRALGIKPENIKLLLDADAEEVEIFKAFKTWLPARVKSTTDVYVFYSGHGLPTSDGLGLYLLPYRADRDLISKTAIQFQEINNDIQVAKPKSVTIFMDACYSGLSRSGDTLLASARPLALKAQTNIFPNGFNVLSASQSDQISSSSPDLKHGIFSYFLMKGMEGDADANKDGKITLGEMHGYLAENVGRQAGMMNRKQEPQMIGDPSRVLVGK